MSVDYQAELESLADRLGPLVGGDCNPLPSDAPDLAISMIRSLQRDLAAALTALRERHAADVEAAFRAGYHCNWLKDEQRYIFDPEMKPGDPDGAYAAWRASEAKARLT